MRVRGGRRHVCPQTYVAALCQYLLGHLGQMMSASSYDERVIVTLPLMLALERLSPLERAVFLLHDVFGLAFEEVAVTIQREPGSVPAARYARANTFAVRGLVSN